MEIYQPTGVMESWRCLVSARNIRTLQLSFILLLPVPLKTAQLSQLC